MNALGQFGLHTSDGSGYERGYRVVTDIQANPSSGLFPPVFRVRQARRPNKHRAQP